MTFFLHKAAVRGRPILQKHCTRTAVAAAVATVRFERRICLQHNAQNSVFSTIFAWYTLFLKRPAIVVVSCYSNWNKCNQKCSLSSLIFFPFLHQIHASQYRLQLCSYTPKSSEAHHSKMGPIWVQLLARNFDGFGFLRNIICRLQFDTIIILPLVAECKSSQMQAKCYTHFFLPTIRSQVTSQVTTKTSAWIG